MNPAELSSHMTGTKMLVSFYGFLQQSHAFVQVSDDVNLSHTALLVTHEDTVSWDALTPVPAHDRALIPTMHRVAFGKIKVNL